MRKTLDPILQQLMFAPTETPLPKFADLDPLSARQHMVQMIAQTEAMLNPGGTVIDRTIKGAETDIGIRIYTPDGADDVTGALVYYHGGGWVVGDLDTHDKTCRILAERSNIRIVSVDYRLAPEHKFPAAPEDGYAALVWVCENAVELGINANKIGVGGDSAGGNIAAAVALMARDRAGPALAVQLLIYPALQYKSETGSTKELAEGYGLETRDMIWFYDHYVSVETDTSNPYLSPLMTQDFSGLPPAVISVAGFDPLHDEGEEFAMHLREAGVEVKFYDYASLVHGFLSLSGIVPSANEAFDEIANATKSFLA